MPRRSSTWSARGPRRAAGTPYRDAQKSRFSRTVRCSYRWDWWPIQPIARRPPATRTDPARGRIRPASTLSSVVLPAPFGPKIASVCPDVRVNNTPSSATTCPLPSPKTCRNPSAESIDTGGEVFQIERLDEVPRVAEVEDVNERLHAHVRRCNDHRKGRLRLSDLLQQGDAVGVGQAEIEYQHFGVKLVHLAACFGPARREGQVVAVGEESLVGPPQRRLVLDEQHFAPRAEGGGTHGGPIYAGPPRRLRALSSDCPPARTGRRAWSAPAGIAAPRWPRAGTPSAGAPPPSVGSTSGHRGPRCRFGAYPRGR